MVISSYIIIKTRIPKEMTVCTKGVWSSQDRDNEALDWSGCHGTI